MISQKICKHPMRIKNPDGSRTCIFCGASVFLLDQKMMKKFIDKFHHIPLPERTIIRDNVSLFITEESYIIAIEGEMPEKLIEVIKRMWVLE